MRALKYSVDLVVYIKSDISVTVIHLRPTSTIVVGIYRLPSANKDSVEPLGELEWWVYNNWGLQSNLARWIVDPIWPDLKYNRNSLIDLIFSNKVDKVIFIHKPFRYWTDSMTSAQSVCKLTPNLHSNFSLVYHTTVLKLHVCLKKVRIKGGVMPWFSPELTNLFLIKKLNLGLKDWWSQPLASFLASPKLVFVSCKANKERKAKSDFNLNYIDSLSSNALKLWML